MSDRKIIYIVLTYDEPGRTGAEQEGLIMIGGICHGQCHLDNGGQGYTIVWLVVRLTAIADRLLAVVIRPDAEGGGP